MGPYNDSHPYFNRIMPERPKLLVTSIDTFRVVSACRPLLERLHGEGEAVRTAVPSKGQAAEIRGILL